MKTKFSIHTLLFLSISLFTTIVSTSYGLNLRDVSQVIIFGDSLSDTGYMNAYPDLPKWKKRANYTTPGGHVWAYYLLKKYADEQAMTNNDTPPAGNEYTSNPPLEGNDYAAGGAVTQGAGIGMKGYAPPSLNYQVNSYFEQHSAADPNALYIVWIGANNFLKLVTNSFNQPARLTINSSLNEEMLMKKAEGATKDIADQVKLLSERGAKHILVINLPAIGNTPLFSNHPALAKMLNAVSSIFNDLLQYRLNQTSVHFALFRSDKLMTEVEKTVENDGYYRFDGLTINNVKNSACPITKGNLPLSLTCKPSPNTKHYLFADIVHPTDTAHRIVAKKIDLFIKNTDF